MLVIFVQVMIASPNCEVPMANVRNDNGSKTQFRPDDDPRWAPVEELLSRLLPGLVERADRMPMKDLEILLDQIMQWRPVDPKDGPVETEELVDHIAVSATRRLLLTAIRQRLLSFVSFRWRTKGDKFAGRADRLLESLRRGGDRFDCERRSILKRLSGRTQKPTQMSIGLTSRVGRGRGTASRRM